VPLAVQVAQDVQPGSPEYWDARREAAREQAEQQDAYFPRLERERKERKRKERQAARP
jgi:hypothetical protein